MNELDIITKSAEHKKINDPENMRINNCKDLGHNLVGSMNHNHWQTQFMKTLKYSAIVLRINISHSAEYNPAILTETVCSIAVV